MLHRVPWSVVSFMTFGISLHVSLEHVYLHTQKLFASVWEQKLFILRLVLFFRLAYFTAMPRSSTITNRARNPPAIPRGIASLLLLLLLLLPAYIIIAYNNHFLILPLLRNYTFSISAWLCCSLRCCII